MRDDTRDQIEGAIADAVYKHGRLPDDWIRVVALLTEETGEAVAAALGMTRRRPSNSILKFRGELAQVASIATQALDRINEEATHDHQAGSEGDSTGLAPESRRPIHPVTDRGPDKGLD